ncbi:ribbon-helix-helix domain-containing protein [Halobellus ordinarius]|uniref:ribbon-helix-helix domain-containing protein n=1 Tax=Halobellus ordinarius TaxID=3075120 RepID=UPI002880B3C8|nr:ribbon-helix-helix domain-containing protein [Halobellus sp. ZY16]
MSGTDTTNGGEPTKTNINIRLTESFLEDIDATWQAEGYNSRSEFIRDALRDAVKHPELTRESWKEIAAVEHARRTGDSETFSREEILADDE